MNGKLFGNFVDMGDSQEFLIISFSSAKTPIQERWRHNSISADFLANYWGTFFPAHSTAPNQHAEVKDAVNFIANELLENAIKFNYYPSGFSMSISLYLSHEALRFYVTNSIAQDNLLIFQNVIHELLAENPQELYIRRLERNADEESGKDSGLGFLTMLNDYNARLAWRFETVQTRPEVTLVTTMVQLPIVRA